MPSYNGRILSRLIHVPVYLVSVHHPDLGDPLHPHQDHPDRGPKDGQGHNGDVIKVGDDHEEKQENDQGKNKACDYLVNLPLEKVLVSVETKCSLNSVFHSILVLRCSLRCS